MLPCPTFDPGARAPAWQCGDLQEAILLAHDRSARLSPHTPARRGYRLLSAPAMAPAMTYQAIP
jgi:hypothetical protein